MFKNWTEAIKKNYPALTPDSKFRFSCHRGLACYTRCCADVNIFLSPYDVLRMKKALNIPSGELLEKYTVAPYMTEEKLPLVLLKMRDDDAKTCPFVTPEGCSIYEDRPWSCRMFPLEVASNRPGEPESCYIAGDVFPCEGFKEDKEWTVDDWRRDQGLDLYEQKSQAYKEITLNPLFQAEKGIGPAKTMMFYVTCYDLDRFRRLILESTFLSRFEIDQDLVAKMTTDDEALLNFAYDWLRFSLFGEDTITIRGEIIEEKKRELVKVKKTGRAHEKRKKSKLSG
jgi:Fe-S-cluster containining protein